MLVIVVIFGFRFFRHVRICLSSLVAIRHSAFFHLKSLGSLQHPSNSNRKLCFSSIQFRAHAMSPQLLIIA
jgi:hypothetical protein